MRGHQRYSGMIAGGLEPTYVGTLIESDGRRIYLALARDQTVCPALVRLVSKTGTTVCVLDLTKLKKTCLYRS